jgi:erythritol transport system permease protein
VSLPASRATHASRDPDPFRALLTGSTYARTFFRLRAVLALVVLSFAFAVLSPAFLSTGNLVILAKHVAINALLAIGMTFVVLSGGIDLSVGSVAGLAGMIAGGLIYRGLVLEPAGVVLYFSAPAVILAGLFVGVVVGWLNGILVTRCRVAPFIATLGTLYVARGAALLRSEGATFPDLAGRAELHNTGFSWIGAGSVLGLPVPIYLMVTVGALAAFVTMKTPFGRHLYAIGGNERAALLAGVPVQRVKLIAYMVCGACAALTGMIIAAQLGSAHPATGSAYELNAIAAVVLGGTSLAGGRGSVGGTIIGAFVIGVLAEGLILLGVSEFWQMVIKGVVIIVAVVLDQVSRAGSARGHNPEAT